MRNFVACAVVVAGSLAGGSLAQAGSIDVMEPDLSARVERPASAPLVERGQAEESQVAHGGYRGPYRGWAGPRGYVGPARGFYGPRSGVSVNIYSGPRYGVPVYGGYRGGYRGGYHQPGCW